MSQSEPNTPSIEEPTIEKVLTPVRETLSERRFQDWHLKQEQKRNKREGYDDTRNDPTHMPDETDHSPSNILNCHRMSYYDAYNAPREDTLPYGIFKFGHDFEAYVESYLETQLSDTELTVDNVIEIDYEYEGLSIAGTTDPVIFDSTGTPVALFEVKATKNTHYVRNGGVKERHLAQAHAYAKGLVEKFDLESPPPIFFVYGGREDLDVAFFEESFDTEFWSDTIVPWMHEDTSLRSQNELPPGVDPDGPKSFMCGYCDYAERCGNYNPSSESPDGDTYVENVDEYWWDDTIATDFQNTVSDFPAFGFVPLKQYPEDVVVSHLASYPDVKLTPTVANQFPEFVVGNDTEVPSRVKDVYGVAPEREVTDWVCEKCMNSFAFEQFDWDGDFDELPSCPDCSSDDAVLRGAKPSEMLLF